MTQNEKNLMNLARTFEDAFGPCAMTAVNQWWVESHAELAGWVENANDEITEEEVIVFKEVSGLLRAIDKYEAIAEYIKWNYEYL